MIKRSLLTLLAIYLANSKGLRLWEVQPREEEPSYDQTELITREYQIIETLLRTRVTNIRKYHLVSRITTSFTIKNKKIGSLKLVIRTKLTTIFILEPDTNSVAESQREYTLRSSSSQNITTLETL